MPLPEMAYPVNDEVNRQLNASWRAYIQQLAELLPQGRFERIEGAAHLVWTTHAGALRGRLRAFVRELAAGGW